MKIKYILAVTSIILTGLFIFILSRDTSTTEPLSVIPVIKLEENFYMEYKGYSQNEFCYFVDESKRNDIKSEAFQAKKYIGDEIGIVIQTLDDSIYDYKIYNVNFDDIEEKSIVYIEDTTYPDTPQYIVYMKVKEFKYEELYDTDKWDDFLTSYSEQQNKR